VYKYWTIQKYKYNEYEWTLLIPGHWHEPTLRKLRKTSGSISGIRICGSVSAMGPKKSFSKYGDPAERIVLCPKTGVSF
jgi:hypothetical protein